MRQWQRERRKERGTFWIILGMDLAAVTLHDNAQAIQAKTIIAAGDFPKRFASPILGR